MQNHVKYHTGDAHTFIRSPVSVITFSGNVHIHVVQFQIVIRVIPREYASVGGPEKLCTVPLRSPVALYILGEIIRP